MTTATSTITEEEDLRFVEMEGETITLTFRVETIQWADFEEITVVEVGICVSLIGDPIAEVS